MQDTDAEASLLINLDGDAPESRNKVRGIKIGRNAGRGRRDGLVKKVIWLKTSRL